MNIILVVSLLPDVPCTPNTDNSITGEVVEHQSWTPDVYSVMVWRTEELAESYQVNQASS